MDNIRKIFAAICAILFVGALVISLLAFNFDRKAFTAETYQTAFAKEAFYEKLPGLMADSIIAGTSNPNNFPIVLQGLDKSAWESFFRSLLPPNVLKAMGDDALNSTFSYINMESDAAYLTLTPLKASLAGDSGVQSVYTFLGNQPPCTLAQIAQMSFDLLSGGQLQLCNPPSDLQSLLTPVIQEQMKIAALAIPDQIEIARAPIQNDPRTRLRDIRFAMRFSLILPIIFLFILTVLTVRSIKDWLGWWGIPFLISGGIAFVISLIGAPLVKVLLQGMLSTRLPTYLPPILLGLAGDLASAMTYALLRPVLWQGLIFAIIGFGMTAAYFIVSRNETITT